MSIVGRGKLSCQQWHLDLTPSQRRGWMDYIWRNELHGYIYPYIVLAVQWVNVSCNQILKALLTALIHTARKKLLYHHLLLKKTS
jgi:hypothetical protein